MESPTAPARNPPAAVALEGRRQVSSVPERGWGWWLLRKLP